jgi:hypothetical protein
VDDNLHLWFWVDEAVGGGTWVPFVHAFWCYSSSEKLG